MISSSVRYHKKMTKRVEIGIIYISYGISGNFTVPRPVLVQFLQKKFFQEGALLRLRFIGFHPVNLGM